MGRLTLEELQRHKQTVVWFKIAGLEEINRVTADRLLTDKDVEDFVTKLLRDTHDHHPEAKLPSLTHWSVRQYVLDETKRPKLELKKIKYAKDDIYEIYESDEGDDIQQNVSNSQVITWRCSRPRHMIEESPQGQSVVVFPRTRCVYVVVKWYNRWLSKKKNPMTALHLEESCMVEQRVTLQQCVDALGIQATKIRTVEIANAGQGVENRQTLHNPDINLQRSIVSYSASPLLEVVITADL